MMIPWVPVIGVLHSIAAVSLVLGLASLVVWAWKTWKPHTYKTVGIWLVAIGAVACLLTASAFAFGLGFDGKTGPGMMKKGKTMRGSAPGAYDCLK